MLLAAAEGDVLLAGLVLQQGHIPGEHQTNLTQNSYFKLHLVVVRGFTASSYILYDCTTSGSRTADEGSSSSLGIGRGANNASA